MIRKEELLKWLEFITQYARKNVNEDEGYLYVWDGRDEQVYQQIEEVIQKNME